MDKNNHKAGFVALIGQPNAGKSTLMNLLLGEKLAITNAKAQTTRHRLFGIVSKKDFQIIYTDTPGIIKPSYPLQSAMMKAVKTAYIDADVIIWLIDVKNFEQNSSDLDTYEHVDAMLKHNKPILLVLNKVDLVSSEVLHASMTYWSKRHANLEIIPISAMKQTNVEQLVQKIIQHLPIHPPYYPDEILTDRPERFFVQEIIREKIMSQYKQEIPYSVEVVVNSFKEQEAIIKIEAIIHVERKTQKAILIGEKGSALNTLGIHARKELERFFQKKIFLALRIKTSLNWRKNYFLLEQFGYPSVQPSQQSKS